MGPKVITLFLMEPCGVSALKGGIDGICETSAEVWLDPAVKMVLFCSDNG